LGNEFKSTVTVENVGKSFEGREIKIITITNGDGRKKNSIFIDGGIHAREWIAPATALYLINQLVDPQSNFSKLLDQMDFVIQPLVNPDGYEYTFNRYRLWRKTRSIKGPACIGVDANRNYDFHWQEVGSSSNSCSETYHGPSAFSEIESQISRNVMLKLKGSCKFFLTLHSYGHYLLYPWGYTNDLPDNWKDNEEVAQAGAQAMKEATGTEYKVGSTSNTLYLASGELKSVQASLTTNIFTLGSSIDYAHSEADIPISIVMELAGGGWFGFDLPAREIERNVKESAIGIYAMSETVAQKFQT
jgi:carboxypeptidase A2